MLMELVIAPVWPRSCVTDRCRSRPPSMARRRCSQPRLCARRRRVHRDIKPANILFANDGAVKPPIFGLPAPPIRRGLTSTGHSVARSPTCRPEQVRADVVDARSDLYSLGLTLYEMSRMPRDSGDTAHSLLNATTDGDAGGARGGESSVPRWISGRSCGRSPRARSALPVGDGVQAALVDDDQTRLAFDRACHASVPARPVTARQPLRCLATPPSGTPPLGTPPVSRRP